MIYLLQHIYDFRRFIIRKRMEDSKFLQRRHQTEMPSRNVYQQKKGFFRNYLKSQAKRFSSLVISNSISIEDNRIYFKIFMLSLEKPPQQRSPDDELATCKVLIEQNIFPEFHNDLTVLRIFAKNITIKHLQSSYQLLSPKTKDENLYKIIKGSITIKKSRINSTYTRQKGEFIQTFEQFSLIKDFQAVCKDQAYMLVINYKAYQEAMKLYLQNKIILKMLNKAPIFLSLKRKQISYLIQKSEDRFLSSKEYLFHEGDHDNQTLYFLVEGEIQISKYNQKKKHHTVCYLNDGSLFGEETIFLQKQRRDYSSCVHSSQARIIEINKISLIQMLTKYQINKELFFNNHKYKDYLLKKIHHYQEKLEQAAHVKEIYKSFVNVKKISDSKQMQMNVILRDAENYAIKLENKEKILEKRNLYMKDKRLITVQTPLFGREDFPGYKQFMKRFEIYEAKAKENSCKLPQLY